MRKPIRIHRDSLLADGIELQIEVLEPDHLDETRWGQVDGGGEIRDGIEYDGDGRRLADWLFPRHPGADTVTLPHGGTAVRVPADEILHVFRPDRPGQNRGVTWFAPARMRLQDLADFEDAQLRRQEIAACFAAFRVCATTISGVSLNTTGATNVSDPLFYRGECQRLVGIGAAATFELNGDEISLCIARPPGGAGAAGVDETSAHGWPSDS